MIYFDFHTLCVLLYIRMHRGKGANWADATSFFHKIRNLEFTLQDLAREGYICVTDEKRRIISFPVDYRPTEPTFLMYSTPKGNEIIERRIFDFWKFWLPLLISIVSLVVSATD